MNDFPLQALITKKAFPIKQLPRFFRCFGIVEAQDDKLNLFTSCVNEKRTFL